MSSGLQHTPIFDLDPAELGEALIRLGALASSMGHKTIQETLNPYCNHPELLSPETQFLHDVLTRPVAEVVKNWYGGEVEASYLISLAVSTALEPDRSPGDDG